LQIYSRLDYYNIKEPKMAHLPLREPDDDLIPLLRKASSEDLGVLVEYIHKVYNEELSAVPEFVKQNPQAKENVYTGNHQEYADEISAEIQRYGGNSFSNTFRGGKGVPYIEIVRDVADSQKVNYNKNADVATIEGQIQMKVLENAYEKMSDEEKAELLKEFGVNIKSGIPAALPVIALQGAIKLSGFAAYKMALIIANATAKALIGRGLSLAANRAMMQALKIAAGPIGWAITVAWTLVDLAGPAYRVTTPCVLQVAYIRQKGLVTLCPKCSEQQHITAKFCSSCGADMQPAE
jgi:uncharacterized protein YaaW (UPF0174 family)